LTVVRTDRGHAVGSHSRPRDGVDVVIVHGGDGSEQ
jgi:hypothetical protein